MTDHCEHDRQHWTRAERLLGDVVEEVRHLSRKVEQAMSIFSEKIVELKAAVAAETNQVQTGVAALKAQIEALKAQLAAETVTPEERAAIIAEIDDAITSVKAIDPSDPTTLPTP